MTKIGLPIKLKRNYTNGVIYLYNNFIACSPPTPNGVTYVPKIANIIFKVPPLLGRLGGVKKRTHYLL